MAANENQPDWSLMAEKFDLWLPQIEPVGNALLNVLAARPGDRVLDVASGTGEPALTLARRLKGQAEIVGIDAAEGMVAVAQAKVEKERLEGIHFEPMPAEKMTFEDKSFHKVMCRFGVMLFQDPGKGLREMQRVVKVGGRAVVAVWSNAEKMPTLRWSHEVFKDRLPPNNQPPLEAATSLGDPELLEKMMTEAGFHGVRVMSKHFDYRFESFDDYWNLLEASEILKRHIDALPPGSQGQIRNEIAQFADEFMTADGLVIPHEYLIASGVK